MTVKPIRLQLTRKKGFNLQEFSHAANGLDAVKIDRTTRFGNPFTVSSDDNGKTWVVRGEDKEYGSFPDKFAASATAIALYRKELATPGLHKLKTPIPALADLIAALRRRNLACWCAPGQACHADVLLETVNEGG